MTAYGPNQPTVAADDASVGTVAWTNLNNAKTPNNAYAQAGLNGVGTTTHYLVLTGFGAIPAAATPVGLAVAIDRLDQAFSGAGMRDNAVRLVKGGVVQATDRASASVWPNVEQTANYGGPADLWGGFTAAEYNAAGFGIAISARSLSGSSLAAIDDALATVYYTEPTEQDGAGTVAADRYPLNPILCPRTVRLMVQVLDAPAYLQFGAGGSALVTPPAAISA